MRQRIGLPNALHQKPSALADGCLRPGSVQLAARPQPSNPSSPALAAPESRPLYNQSGVVAAEQVILVEGEKCAQALIEAGITATTAMHGANAPVDKTDWSPLAGKAVLIWPDRDKPGFGYAEAASQAVLMAGATSCAILLPPDAKPEGWDAADALAEGFDQVRGKPRPSGRGRIARTAAPSYNGVAADNQGSLRQGMPEVTPVEIRAAVAHSAQEPTEATHSGSMPG